MSLYDARVVIDKPGIYDIPEDEYHRDCVPAELGGSLSVSGAKLLLPPGCPAVFDYRRRHPRPPTAAMELGTVVHGMVLGTGQEVEVLDFPSFTTKAAKEARDKAIEAGRVPMLAEKYAEAQAIARAVRDDDEAGGLFAEGDAEQSMFWVDPEFGTWLRGRMDWLTYIDGRPVIGDLKTTSDASPEKFAKSADEYRYYMQDPWYREGLAAILGCDWDDIAFLFCVVQAEEPHLVMTYQLEAADVARGREQNRIAREKYRDCTEANVWPKWSRDITPLSLPGYARRRIDGEINEWND